MSPELDELLLCVELAPPLCPQPGSASRADLIATAGASGCRVVGVTAPAGYGKSTLLAEWAVADERPVAWVSLDRLDDDPAALLTVLAASYGISPANADVITAVNGRGLQQWAALRPVWPRR